MTIGSNNACLIYHSDFQESTDTRYIFKQQCS